MKQKQVLHTHIHINHSANKKSISEIIKYSRNKNPQKLECFKDKIIGNLSEYRVRRQSDRKGEERVMKLWSHYRKSNVRLLRTSRKRTEEI